MDVDEESDKNGKENFTEEENAFYTLQIDHIIHHDQRNGVYIHISYYLGTMLALRLHHTNINTYNPLAPVSPPFYPCCSSMKH